MKVFRHSFLILTGLIFLPWNAWGEGEPLGIAEQGSAEAERIEITRDSELQGALESPSEARQHQRALDRERGKPSRTSSPSATTTSADRPPAPAPTTEYSPPPPAPTTEYSPPPPPPAPAAEPVSPSEGDLSLGSEPEWLRRGGHPDRPPPRRARAITIEVKVASEGNKVETPPFRFGPWVTDLSERNRVILDQIASLIKENPDAIPKVQIGAYTDNSGDPAINEALSIARANVVKAYLVWKGVGVHRLEAKGFGEESPIESNETKQGRAKNRRVAFAIIK